MRLRRGAWIGVAIVAVVALCGFLGCGDDTSGSSATGAMPDAGEPFDSTTFPPGDDADAGFADAHGFEDATTAFEPSDSSTGTLPGPCTEGTTLSGTVYDPAGILPLFNALVYVPSDSEAQLPPLTPGLTTGTGSCSDSCDPTIGTYSTGKYVAAVTTDFLGAFTLDNVPSGQNIPLVIQLGKWRRRVTLNVRSCANTAVPASLSRLPRNQGEGDIPQMAVVTGACDELACLLRHIGLDAAEFTGPTGGGRVHVYKGAGAAPDLADGGAGPAGDCSGAGCPLWSTKAALEKYDLVLLGCECGEHNETKPDMGPMHDWLDEGGRVLATHYQDTWFKNGPADLQGVASWESSEADGPTSGPFQVDTSFTAGNDLRNWLGDLGAFNADGSLTLPAADVSTSLTEVSANATRWIYDSYQLNASMEPVPKLFSFETPVGGVPRPADGGASTWTPYCGRAFFTDVHAGGGGVASSSPVPRSCTAADTSAEEKSLEYAFFNLSGPCYIAPPPHP
jgi:hypothetical protein